ncbi:MAG: hypothetical protein QOE60_2468 [Thermoleophilaceae bacterium]|nr:hypothetical protein [Thermoleophilaceae bacterium]
MTNGATVDRDLDQLSDEAVEVRHYRDTGQLAVKTVEDTYLSGGGFDAEAMIALIREEVRASQGDEFTGLRLTGDLSWANSAIAGIDGLFDYERAIDEIYQETGAMAVCSYDTRRVDAEMVTGAVQAHRSVVSRRRQEVLDTPLLTLLVITRDADGGLSLYGEVDDSNVGEFEAALLTAVDSRAEQVVDLTHLQFIDLSGLRALERQAERLAAAGQRLVLASPPAFVTRVMSMLDLDQRLEVVG